MLGQDLRYVLRCMRKRPGTSLVVVATLALAIAANTTTFSLVDAVLLKPLPFTDPDRLVALWDIANTNGGEVWRVSGSNFTRWQEQNEVFDSMALYGATSAVLHAAGDPVQVSGSRVTQEFFSLLGVRSELGRPFSPADFAADAEPAIVISDALWRNQLGSDPAVIGSSLRLDDDSYTVVGVLPRQILPLVAWSGGRVEFGSTTPHYWVPLPKVSDHFGHTDGVLARLGHDVSLEQADSFMDTVALRLERTFPETNTGFGVRVVPLRDHAVGDVQDSFSILLAAVGLVLLIACANVSSVLLARAEDRVKELAIRSALGAGALRIARLVALEGVVFVAIGGFLGVLIGRVALVVLPRWTPQQIPRLDESTMDGRALLATLGLCAVSALCCTLLPALRASRRDPGPTLQIGGRGNDSGSSTSRMRRLLVVAEVALAVVLIVGSGLLIQSLVRLQQVDSGFDQRSMLVLELQHTSARYPEMQQLNGFYDELRAQVSALPGVRSVAAAYDHPLTSNWTQSFRIEDAPAPAPGNTPAALFRTVTPGYFDTVGIPLLAGRDFSEGDRADTAGAVIINESFARKYFPDSNPVGKRLSIGTTIWQWGDAIPTSFHIVGLVGDVRFWGPESELTPAFYIPYRQTPQYKMQLLVNTDSDPAALLPAVRARLHDLDPALPITHVETIEGLLDATVAKPRFGTLVLAFSAATSLLLALVGLWGMLNQVALQRNHEIGVRLALGARPLGVFKLMLRHGLMAALTGVLIGTVTSVVLSRFLRSVLFETRPTNVSTYVTAAGLLLGTSLIACALPALKAARVDPLIVLRSD